MGCCKAKDAKAIQHTVNQVIREECPNCYQMIREYKCSECSPDSSLFYVNKASSIRFCEDYCHALFDVCKDIPLDAYTKNPDGSHAVFYLNTPGMTSDIWCAGRTAEEGYCFRGTIPEARDENCKCEDQSCHTEFSPVFAYSGRDDQKEAGVKFSAYDGDQEQPPAQDQAQQDKEEL